MRKSRWKDGGPHGPPLFFFSSCGIVAADRGDQIMVEYVDGWAARMARSRVERKCRLCHGKIHKRMMYISRDDRKHGSRWMLHEHVDCLAPWWQTRIDHLLGAVGDMPGNVPPEAEVDPRLEGFDLVFRIGTEELGEITFRPGPEIKQRFLHTPDLALRDKAQREIELYLGLSLDVIFRAFGNRRAAFMLSNIAQQMQQVAETAYADKSITK